MTNYAEVKHFIRNILGCNCPDEVFERIEIESNLVTNKILVDVTIYVGGRLLVFVIYAEDFETISNDLESVFQQGKQIRDRQGYNRFRLVVCAREIAEMQAKLCPVFESLVNIDERLHLHIIDAKEVPAFLRHTDSRTRVTANRS